MAAQQATASAGAAVGARHIRLGLALCVGGLAALGVPLLRTGALSLALLYALGGGMCWAAGTVMTKAYPVAAPPLTIAAWQLLIGAAVAAPGMLIFEGMPWPHAL